REGLQERVGIDVRDEQEGGPAVPVDLERRLETATSLEDDAGERSHEGPIAGTLAVVVAAPLVDPPHRFGVEADPCAEGEPPSVCAARRDPADAVERKGLRQLLRRCDRVTRQPEGTRENARSS